jgi:hypothetical protein
VPIRHADSAVRADTADSRHARELFRRWPTVLGLGVAAVLLVTGAASRETLAIGATAAAWCYLVAAASGRRWVGWAAIPAAFVVIMVSELIGLPWWTGLSATGLVLVIIGLRRPASRAVLLAQAAAFTGICTVAVVALAWDPRAGVVLAGVLLASHAIWDAIHYRRRLAVSRSLAEACLSLDLLLGLGLIAIAVVAP